MLSSWRDLDKKCALIVVARKRSRKPSRWKCVYEKWKLRTKSKLLLLQVKVYARRVKSLAVWKLTISYTWNKYFSRPKGKCFRCFWSKYLVTICTHWILTNAKHCIFNRENIIANTSILLTDLKSTHIQVDSFSYVVSLRIIYYWGSKFIKRLKKYLNGWYFKDLNY